MSKPGKPRKRRPQPILRGSIVRQILDERCAQDREWGGPDHDDNHYPGDWLNLIERQVRRAWPVDAFEYRRRRLVKIAALAVAAMDSFDRTKADRHGDEG